MGVCLHPGDKMQSKIGWILVIILIAVAFGSSMLVSSRLPDRIVSHWDAAGQPNGCMPKTTALYLVPCMTVLFFLILQLLPMIDPLRENIQKFQNTFDMFLVGFVGFMTYIHLLTITWNLGAKMNMITWMMPGMAALMYLTGHVMGKAKRNYFIGIRTPWTLANDQVWDETHRLGGICFKIVAAFALVGVFFPTLAIFFMMVPLMLVSTLTIIYSYVRYNDITRRQV
jgi:uncharacterized membrane protein